MLSFCKPLFEILGAQSGLKQFHNNNSEAIGPYIYISKDTFGYWFLYPIHGIFEYLTRVVVAAS